MVGHLAIAEHFGELHKGLQVREVGKHQKRHLSLSTSSKTPHTYKLPRILFKVVLGLECHYYDYSVQ